MYAADGRLVAGVAEWLFGEVLLDVRFNPANQRSSSIIYLAASTRRKIDDLMWC